MVICPELFQCISDSTLPISTVNCIISALDTKPRRNVAAFSAMCTTRTQFPQQSSIPLFFSSDHRPYNPYRLPRAACCCSPCSVASRPSDSVPCPRAVPVSATTARQHSRRSPLSQSTHNTGIRPISRVISGQCGAQAAYKRRQLRRR